MYWNAVGFFAILIFGCFGGAAIVIGTVAAVVNIHWIFAAGVLILPLWMAGMTSLIDAL